MASDPVANPPDTTPTMTPYPTAIPPDTNFTMAPDLVVTPPDNKVVMASDPPVDFLPTTSVMTPDMVATSPDQTSFASLPREIRDEIYRLAIPHSCDLNLFVGGGPHFQPGPSGLYQILSPQASTSTYADEACAMLFKRNTFRVWIQDLQVILGDDGINYAFHSKYYNVYVIPKGGFDVKPWLRDIVLAIQVTDKMDELAERIGLLLKCPTLQTVEAKLYGGGCEMERAVSISSEFKALAEKLGRGLSLSVAFEGYLHRIGRA